jgi:GMP synthase-like glutamine amidotransferase
MKPVAIFQHTRVGDPGTVPRILADLDVPVQIVRIVDGEPVPRTPQAYSGLVFMGGFMAVDDPHPWIAQEMELIRSADVAGIPVAGHCLGSQLMAVAFGGRVQRNHVMEIGWGQLVASDAEEASEWLHLPPGTRFTTFQWHRDTFVPPPGAKRLAASDWCAEQMFVHRGRHMAIQSHLEMTPALVQASIEKNGAELLAEHAAGNPAVTSMQETLRDVAQRCADMHGTLARCYGRWAEGLRRH